MKEKFKGKNLSYEKEILEDGTLVFHIDAAGIREKCTFTEV